MTLILAALKDGCAVMGGDRCFGSGTSKVPEVYTHADPKIWQHDGVLLGCCGSHRLSQVLRHELPPFPGGELAAWIDGPVTELFLGMQERKLEIATESMLLAATPSEVVIICYGDQSWAKGQESGALSYLCVGSGRHWAYGACHAAGVLDVDAREAVRLGLDGAARHCATVAGPFDFLEVAA